MTRPRQRERGFTLIFVAVTLVVLLVFTAFAVDLGALYNERRQDQNAADSGSLAGAQTAFNGASDAAIVTEVQLLVRETLGFSASDPDWTSLNWDSCSLTDGDAVDTEVNGLSCITTNGNAKTRIQVKLPAQTYETFFGGVVGADTFDHTAFAIAGVVSVGFGNVLPFGLPGGAGGGDGYECIKTGTSGHSEPPCGGPASGNFGYVEFAFYGNSDIGTTEDCTGHPNERRANNMAAGMDHRLSVYTGAEVHDTNNPCPKSTDPNSMSTDTGMTPNVMGEGMFSGTSFSDGAPARLQRTNLAAEQLPYAATSDVGGQDLDDIPLWDFIDPALTTTADVPDSCIRDQFTGPDGVFGNGDDMDNLPALVRTHFESATPAITDTERGRRLLQRCFSHYNLVEWDDNGAITPDGEDESGCDAACDDPVFARNSGNEDPDLYDIQYTPRFGYVPELVQSSFPNGTATVNIAGFRAIYMQRLLAGTCPSGNCTHDFEPGVGYSNSSAESKAEGMTVFVFPRSMLPNGLGNDDAPWALGRNRFIRLVR